MITSLSLFNAKITEINGKLTSYASTKVTNDGTYCTEGKYWIVERFGKQVNMHGRVYLQNVEPAKWYTIGQIPDGYKPTINHAHCLFSIKDDGAPIECIVEKTGAVQIRTTKAIGGSNVVWYPLATLCWITNDEFQG